jgi:predicted RNA-binding Zn-ribbon protein involved in translation (DUF1610 family)
MSKGAGGMSFFKKLSETVSKGVSTATEKAQQTVEITKLNVQISGKRKEIEKLFTTIGESVYEAYLEKDQSLAQVKVVPISEEITAIRNEINALDDRIKAIRNEKDCVCGKRVPFDTRYCPSCGHAFPEPEIVKDYPIQVETYVPEAPLEEELLDHQGETVLDSDEVAAFKDESVRAMDQRQICKSCGTPLYADSHYCPNCGQPTR